VRFFVREPSGALHQAAQIVGGVTDAGALAAIAADLSDAFGWLPEAKAKPEPRPKQLAEGPRGRQRRMPYRTREQIAAYDQRIYELIAVQQNGMTPPMLMELIHPTEVRKHAGNAVRGALDRLIKADRVVKVKGPHNAAPDRYYAKAA